MTDENAAALPLDIPLTRSVAADSSTADQMALALYRVMLRQPMFWLKYLLFALCVTGLLMLGYVSAGFLAGSTLGFVALSCWLRYQTLRRQFRAMVPPETVLATGFGPTTMALQGSASMGQVDYSAFRRIHTSGDFVILERSTGLLFTVLPRVLFTTEDLERVRAGLGSSRGSSGKLSSATPPRD